VVDICQDAPATAQASFNIVRCTISAAFVAVLEEMISGIGFGWTFTILGSLCLISGVFYFIELRYGRIWRIARNNMSIEGTNARIIPLGSRSGTSEQAS
jgi:hypothetical protein